MLASATSCTSEALAAFRELLMCIHARLACHRLDCEKRATSSAKNNTPALSRPNSHPPATNCCHAGPIRRCVTVSRSS